MRFHFHCISYHATASHDLPLLVTCIAQPYFQCFISYKTGSQGLFGYTLTLNVAVVLLLRESDELLGHFSVSCDPQV